MILHHPQFVPFLVVFLSGFPGASGTMVKTKLDDFNSETQFKGGFETAHMNTVALNGNTVIAS